jgi:hypothetical protein
MTYVQPIFFRQPNRPGSAGYGQATSTGYSHSNPASSTTNKAVAAPGGCSQSGYIQHFQTAAASGCSHQNKTTASSGYSQGKTRTNKAFNRQLGTLLKRPVCHNYLNNFVFETPWLLFATVPVWRVTIVNASYFKFLLLLTLTI